MLHQIMSCRGCNDGGGTSSGGSSADTDVHVNELSIAHVLLERAAQLDRANVRRSGAVASAAAASAAARGSGGKKKSQKHHGNSVAAAPSRRHLRSLLLSAESESNYTPLHAAMYHRRLRPILLLLRHAAQSAARSGDDADDYDVRNMSIMKIHPILMLDDSNAGGGAGSGANSATSTKTKKGGSSSGGRGKRQFNRSGSSGINSGDNLLLDMVSARDGEGLTPLDLLCKSMSSDLARCRRYLDQLRIDAIGGGGGGGGRDRSTSLVDDDDDDEEEDSDEVVTGRPRGTSFGNVHDVDLDADGPVLANNDVGGRNRNDFGALQGTGRDANAPTNDTDNESNSSSTPREEEGPGRPQTPSRCTYGCEVMTFGRADHCALGVPHFASRRAVEETGKANSASGGQGGKSGGSSVRPRRVEAFALGEMGRSLGDKDDVDSSSNSDGDESPGSAVAVAAAAHHTLVATAKGHLMAFGLGKGGRLGTGDENHRPLPTRILGPLSRRRVIGIAAALNHSLCSTSDGGLYSWGSNRFGQLGISTGTSNNPSTGTSDQRCLPRRVDDLRRDVIVSVAAGDRHSVALTRRGEVYCWGDNRAGQLGMALRGDGRGRNGSPGSSNSYCDRPKRVSYLWSASPKRRVTSVAAAEQSTLVLVLPARVHESTNTVYSWGHGNSVPVRISFPSPDIGTATEKLHHRHGRFSGLGVNPTGISAAKHHNAAITSAGLVYCWGLHSEPLGMASSGDHVGEWESNDGKRTSSVGSMVIASPQLVTGMLPENGGGIAVAVSASENHTAVITDAGALYTWGANESSDVLGHEGVKWQPVPRRVPGVHRVVGLAAAKEHTALLIGTSFPCFPMPKRSQQAAKGAPRLSDDQPSSAQTLQDLATRSIAQHVDLFNTLPLLIMAERLGCGILISYCMSFIRRNLDAVLSLAKRTILDMYLDESVSKFLSPPDSEDERDALLHPMILYLARAGLGASSEVSTNWMSASPGLVDSLPDAALARASPQSKPYDVTNKSIAKTDLDSATKAMEACAIDREKARSNDDATEKKPVAISEPVAQVSKPKETFDEAIDAEKAKAPTPSSCHRCELCNVTCPDESAYAMHIGGKKHRNRALKLEEEEKEKAVVEMMESKRRQMLTADEFEASSDTKPRAVVKSPWNMESEPSIQPRYRLQPPAPPVYESKARRAKMDASTKVIAKKPASFQSILEEEQRLLQAKKSPQMSTSTPLKPPSLATANAITLPTTPIYRQGMKPSAASPSSKMSLGAFLEPKTKPSPKKTGPAWSTGSSTSSTFSKPQAEPPRRKTSFNEIQRGEEELKAKQDGMCATGMKGKWYVERRERAASISAIAEEAEEERAMQQLIEEQIAIEAQIAREQESLKQQQQQQQQKEGGGQKKSRGSAKRRGGRGRGRGRSQGRGGGRGSKNSVSGASSSSPSPSAAGKAS